MTLKRRLKIIDLRTEEEWMSKALKVAFASTDLKHVDQHFGSAESFVVYGVTQDDAHMIEIMQFGDLEQDGNEDKLTPKMDALTDCCAVFVQAVGGSAVRQLTSMGVQPVKVSFGAPIQELIDAMQDELREGPTSWLSRALERQKAPDRFDQMDAEGWDE